MIGEPKRENSEQCSGAVLITFQQNCLHVTGHSCLEVFGTFQLGAINLPLINADGFIE